MQQRHEKSAATADTLRSSPSGDNDESKGDPGARAAAASDRRCMTLLNPRLELLPVKSLVECASEPEFDSDDRLRTTLI